MLRRTTVGELLVNEPSTGLYLLLRTLGPIVRGTINTDFGQNVTVPVEDHDKNRSRCCPHGHVHLESEKELADLLPINSVFALKEPLLVASSEQNFTIVVGSPSDFVVVGRNHVLYEDAETLGWREKTVDEGMELTSKWKQIGDALYQKGKHQEACDAYLFALNNAGDDETNFILKVNLAKCFLAQDCYESAMKHAFEALKFRPSNENALYLAARALYKIGRFSLAKTYFERLARASDEQFSGELSRCEKRIGEANGNIDIHNLFLASLSGVIPTDVGTFVGDLDFPLSTDNERGVFATKDLEPGTLILVEKPVVSFIQPAGSLDHGGDEFIRTVLTTVLKNPQTFGRKLYRLPGGGIQTDAKSRTFCDEARKLEPIVDVRYLHQVVDKNIFKTINTMTRYPSFTYLVYDVASRFRHFCFSNCTYVIYKDVVTVRTCYRVRKGDELLLRYFGNWVNFREKEKALERYGFTCKCALCFIDRTELTGVQVLREELGYMFYSEIRQHVNDCSGAEENLLPIVRELEVTYKNRGALRLQLCSVYFSLAKVLDARSEDWKSKVTLYVEKGLQCVNLSTDLLFSCTEQANQEIPKYILLPDLLFLYAGLMLEVEYSSGNLDLVKKWVKVLLLLERIYRGGNLEMLKHRFLGPSMVPTLLSEFATL